jgi:hypothetical protein
MAEIIIEPQNPLDLREEDLRSLAKVLSPELPGHRIGYAYHLPQEGIYGVTWPEVVYIWLPAVAGGLAKELVDAVLAQAVAWARSRFKREGAPKRPKYVAIYGPNGEVLASVEIMDEVSLPEVLAGQDSQAGLRKMPPVQGYFEDIDE